MNDTLTHEIARFEDDGGSAIEERRPRPAKIVELLTPRQRYNEDEYPDMYEAQQNMSDCGGF